LSDVARGPVSASVLKIDMDNITCRETVADAFRLSGASRIKFARVMGVHIRTLTKYLEGSKSPSPTACRAAIFAAMCLGVSMRVPRITDLSTTTNKGE
jgi:transcriptional regulator with XRE-family HTH domain